MGAARLAGRGSSGGGCLRLEQHQERLEQQQQQHNGVEEGAAVWPWQRLLEQEESRGTPQRLLACWSQRGRHSAAAAGGRMCQSLTARGSAAACSTWRLPQALAQALGAVLSPVGAGVLNRGWRLNSAAG